MIFMEKLRAACIAYGERDMSIPRNHAWKAVSVAMLYFVLVTDFHFATPMADHEKAERLTKLRGLGFAGPKLPAYFLQ